jgi:hypothetical protein
MVVSFMEKPFVGMQGFCFNHLYLRKLLFYSRSADFIPDFATALVTVTKPLAFHKRQRYSSNAPVWERRRSWW